MNFAFDGYELTYSDDEAEKIIRLWQVGKNLLEIAEEARPTKWGWKDAGQGQREVYVILGDLARRGLIAPREGGLLAGLAS